MKIHPTVGAEILEQVDFPYPVVPIVRAHHEKWDGSGYPNGLAGEAIPIGARILSTVDCLDALASDRQYRKALPLREAMAKVASEAGAAFDPRVVTILQRRYVEWERLARLQPLQAPPKLSTDIKVERGLAPDAGFAGAPRTTSPVADSVERLAAGRQQAESLTELGHRVKGLLSLDDLLSLLSARLKRLVTYDAMAVYLCKNNVLVADFVSGENFRLFSSLQIPLGEGLSGWVAQNHKPILNGNPSVEPGYLNDPTQYSRLRSALAVPLEGSAAVAAVLALYRAGQDAFTKDDLRVVEALTYRFGAAIEQAAIPKAAGTAAGAI
jgi:GAF domain-containing protein